MSSSYSLKKPLLVLVVGVAGSGKSTFGRKLVRELNDSTFISKDLIQQNLLPKNFNFVSTEDEDKHYKTVSPQTFDILLDFSNEQLKAGKTPVIDCPFSNNHNRNDRQKNWVEPFLEIAKSNNTQLAIIRCRPSDSDELKKRLVNRGASRDKWKLENWDEFLKTEPIDFPIEHDKVLDLVTNDVSFDEIFKKFLEP